MELVLDSAAHSTTPFFTPLRPSPPLFSPILQVRRYIRGWMLVDLLCALPLSEIGSAFNSHPSDQQALRLVRCLRLVRGLRPVSHDGLPALVSLSVRETQDS